MDDALIDVLFQFGLAVAVEDEDAAVGQGHHLATGARTGRHAARLHLIEIGRFMCFLLLFH